MPLQRLVRCPDDGDSLIRRVRISEEALAAARLGREKGMSLEEIRLGLERLGFANISKSTLRRILDTAPPEQIEVYFPINGIKPEKTCGHCNCPIPEDDRVYCADCDKTGIEDDRRLYRNPRTTPKPDVKLPEMPKVKPTRKQRRAAKVKHT